MKNKFQTFQTIELTNTKCNLLSKMEKNKSKPFIKNKMNRGIKVIFGKS